MPVQMPGATTRWRCAQCGNLTRFDVVHTARQREFWHVDLAGEPVVEQVEVLDDRVESISCRWCNGIDTVELVERPTGQAAPPGGGT